jgi:hypothetical protein
VRWGRNESISQKAMIARGIADAKDAVDAERASEIRAARENVRLKLLSHGLVMASQAVRINGEAGVSFSDYKLMNDRIRSGGYHRVRLTGGRNLDG